MCLGTRHLFYLPPLWKKRLRIYSALFTGENQLSSDNYIVACSFLSRIQRDIYHCSWGKGGREGEVSCAAAMCISFFFNPYYFLSVWKNTVPPSSLIHLRFPTCYFSFISVSPPMSLSSPLFFKSQFSSPCFSWQHYNSDGICSRKM